jgi:hypothetical protein
MAANVITMTMAEILHVLFVLKDVFNKLATVIFFLPAVFILPAFF